jgi:hypothetical protein
VARPVPATMMIISLVEMRVHLDGDAGLPPAPAAVPQGSP